MATVAEAAEHIFLSERRFYELLDKSAIDRAGAGRYELDVVREQYIEHLRAQAAGRSSEEGGLSLEGERARLAKEQADAAAMKNAATRHELLPRDEIHQAVTSAFARVKAKLLGLPTKIAPRVMGLKSTAEVQKKIADGIHEALRELASTEVAGMPVPGDDGSADPGGGGGLVVRPVAAADDDGVGVGRRGKAAQPRGKRRARQVGDEPG